MKPDAILEALDMRLEGRSEEEIGRFLLKSAGMKPDAITNNAIQQAITAFEKFIAELKQTAKAIHKPN
jgi:hypothetical protein